ncbi:8024_t:CDS:1 [Paraglomus occultum]|uniref:Diphosphomevalonate decarboxylase n=1 Tax=Paraglomus occultum TaxID=144539 RepID=A0A9N8Z6U8_9GLOM|nr:8024_t:CDS:1 [Paraglomus occultum]
MPDYYEKTCTAPVNIAVIKYWGKRDVSLNLPTNSSLSVTLSQDNLQSKTTIRADPSFSKTRLWLNGVEEDVSASKRIQTCIKEARRLRSLYEQQLLRDGNSEVVPLSEYNLHICSENNFPTAAGLASSASGFACFVYTLAQLYSLPNSLSELSIIARQGSGSACRSLFGGFVAWEMGVNNDGSDSMAVQIADEHHWPELIALICVVSDAKKAIGSTVGMQVTVKTSSLLKERIECVVPKRMEEMVKAIKDKDFDAFAELTMRDSNQFHAVCLDSFPPIFYLNDISRAIIRLVEEYNSTSCNYKAAYTFDAGPNAVIYTLRENADELVGLIKRYFMGEEREQIPSGFRADAVPIFEEGSVKQLIRTTVGDGPRVIEDGLLNEDGMPKS